MTGASSGDPSCQELARLTDPVPETHEVSFRLSSHGSLRSPSLWIGSNFSTFTPVI